MGKLTITVDETLSGFVATDSEMGIVGTGDSRRAALESWTKQAIDANVLTSALPLSPVIWSWPTRDKVITQKYGVNPQDYARFGLPGHEGLDIATRTSLDVYACYAGRVYMVADWPNKHPYGLHVRTESKLPDGRVLKITYAHLAPGSVRVKVSDMVPAGRLLGQVGRTGNIRGLHLHVTFKVNDVIVDPYPFLREAMKA